MSQLLFPTSKLQRHGIEMFWAVSMGPKSGLNLLQGFALGQLRLIPQADPVSKHGCRVVEMRAFRYGCAEVEANEFRCECSVVEELEFCYRFSVVESGSGEEPELAGDNSPIAKFLSKNPSGGLHHLCLEVDDIQESLDFVSEKVRVLDKKPKIGAHGNPVAFLHPKDSDGVLLEMEEVKPAK
eukprot:gene6300-7551_t